MKKGSDTMKKMKFSEHILNERMERAVAIAMAVGMGEIVLSIPDKHPGRTASLTSTGVVLITANNGVVVTMYLATYEQIDKMYETFEANGIGIISDDSENFDLEDIKEACEFAHKLNKKVYVTVNMIFHNEDLNGLDEYLKALDEIGIDVQAHKKDNYTEPLDSKIRDILECLIDPNFGFSENAYYWAPLLAFDSSNETNPKILLANKIKIINYLLGNAQDKITEENFESFTETKEFLQLLEKINEFKTIYEKFFVLPAYGNNSGDLLHERGRRYTGCYICNTKLLRSNF